MPLLESLPDFVEKSLVEHRLPSGSPVVALGTLLDSESTETTGVETSPVNAVVEVSTDRFVTAAESESASITEEELLADGEEITSEVGKDELSLAKESEDSDETEEMEEVTRIAFATDLDSEGSFNPEWLVVEDGNLYVFTRNGDAKAHLKRAIPVSEIREAKAETYFGNGQLEIRTNSETIPLVRFSQAVTGEANTIARQITAMAKGQRARAEKHIETRKLCPKCRRMLPEDTEVCPGCVNRRRIIIRLFEFLRPFKREVAASVVVILVSRMLDLLPPWIGKLIIDNLTSQQKAHTVAVQPIIMLVLVLLGARLIGGGMDYVARRVQAFLGARVSMDIRVTLYSKFTQLSLGYYDKRSTGTVMSRITNDSEQIWDFLTDGAPWFVSNIISLLSISVMLFTMNWRLATLLLLPAPFIFALNKWFMPRARKKWHHVWHRISKMHSTLNSSLNGMRVVKAFAQEGKEAGRFAQKNEQVFQASFAANAMWATYWPILSLLMGLGSYIIWIYGGSQVLVGAMTLGTLTAFSGYLMQFYAPFQNFTRVLDWTTRSLTAAERVFEILDTEPDIRDVNNAVSMTDIKGAVEFENVSFTYDKAKRVLEDFTLKVEPGEMIGLVGHSGAGKSTIINLLSRFYDTTEGTIKIDGVDIRKIKQNDFRHQFGIVLQEPFLFPGTIRDNIAYAKPEASVDEVLRAAKAANCHNFILKFPDGYDTQVGERGQRLSGGERQRISIARAILHDPKILILDEATASVDTETEKLIQEAISRLIQNRTTFAIAHRLSTLRNASRLVVMKDGKMAECGTHDELMDLDGVYANLVKIQNEVNKLRAV